MGVGKVTRRAFLGLGVAAAGGLAVGYWVVTRPYANPLEDDLAEGEATFNPYVKIGADGTITIIAPRAEMGQGVSTTLAALVAEELDVGLDQVTVEHGPADGAYYNSAMMEEAPNFPHWDHSWLAETARAAAAGAGKALGLQVTGGSSSTIDAYVKMRKAGAAARLALVEAAALRWNAAPETLTTERARIVNPATGDALSYAEVAAEAATLEARADPPLRDPAAWRILGKPAPRTDMRAKVTGAPIYGIDVQLDAMLHGAVRMAPRFGAEAVSVDDAAARAVPGVLRVVPLRTQFGAGFGVIADNTWSAFRGAEALDVRWSEAAYPKDTRAQFAALSQGLEAEGFELGGEGDAPAVFEAAPASEIIEAEYRVPFLAHACMEPMNATAQLVGGKLRIWAPTQAPTIVQQVCGAVVGLSAEDVEVTTTFLGGGFGRRAEADFACYAALLAAETDGRPIKVTWTREEDTTHDAYRPAALGRFRAHVRPGEGPTALEMRVAAPPIMSSVLGRTFPSLPAAGPDKPILDGLFNQPYAIANQRFEGVPVDLGIPVGFWRSVGNSFNGFFHEGFIDEIAHAAGLDPVEARLRMMQGEDFAPARKAVEKVAEMADWGSVAEGRGKGVAFTLSFGAWVAEVVEVSTSQAGLRVENVWCAADLGRVLDPSIVEAQMMSGIVFGLSSAMMQEITFADGEAQEANFDAYDAIRMRQCPNIEVALLSDAPKMGGAGEPGVPPSIPALANAIFAATGVRLREAPFGKTIAFA